MENLVKILVVVAAILLVVVSIGIATSNDFEINKEALSENGDGFVACTGETCYICPEPASSEKCQEVKRRM